MAIDQDIERKVDAYRGNPQALMQRYQQNQQLIDLLALQKLKSEKDSAAKQLQLQAAQDPQTIKQQREQELLARTKQDMIKQQSGIMQQAQQRQQSNMQQVAKQGAASPQQVQQVASGLGALSQRQGPQRMAAGGIVAFSDGGLTEKEQAEVNNYRERLKKTNRRAASRMSDEDILKQLNSRAFGMAPEEDIAALRQKSAPGSTLKYMDEGIVAKRLSDVQGPSSVTQAPRPAALLQSPELPSVAQQPELPSVAQQPGLPSVAQQPPVVPSNPMGSGKSSLEINSVGGLGALNAPTIPDPTGTWGDRINKQYGLYNANANNAAAKMQETREGTAEFMGRGAQQDRYNKLRERMQEFDTKNTDPNRDRADRINAFLLGAGGKSSFAGAMGGGGRAMQAMKDKQYGAENQRILDLMKLEGHASDSDFKIAERAQKSGEQAAEREGYNARSAAATVVNMTQLELSKLLKEADLVISERKAAIDKLKIESTERLRKAVEHQTDREYLDKLLNKTRAAKAELWQSLTVDNQRLDMLRNKSRDPKATEEDRKALKRYEGELDFIFRQAANKGGLLLEEERILGLLGQPNVDMQAAYAALEKGLDTKTQKDLDKYSRK